MNKYTMLIAEDDAATLRMLEKGFRAAGFTLHSTKTCAKALELIKEHKFDCLLLDYCLEMERHMIYVKRSAPMKK